MAVFVDLDDEDVEPPQGCLSPHLWVAAGETGGDSTSRKRREEPQQPVVRENPNQNSMTRALGCYPIVISLAASIDLNTLDSLSRTCHQIRAGVLQYRTALLVSTLRCSNEHIPVNPQETLRLRVRASNVWYMEDARRASDDGKTGKCARDMVSECRRCGTVVCRNCTIKPPAPVVLRERHRRLCMACSQVSLAWLVQPRLASDLTLSSEKLGVGVCQCDSRGVWLCQPCGRGIRSEDAEYRSIWKWRYQYSEMLGGLGTGIGEGDRGVPCGRESECCASHEREQETDCDAADARDADNLSQTSSSYPTTAALSPWSLSSTTTSTASSVSDDAAAADRQRRAPSPQLRPGYERHEIEGIGFVIKRKLLRMVKVGACVPEWDDERVQFHTLSREASGARRSWCGWCWRAIPSKKDWEVAKRMEENQAKEKALVRR